LDRRVALGFALAALAAAGGVWWQWFRNPGPIEWQGYAEADFVKIGPTLEGRLTDVFVMRGEKVAAGAKLFDQDDIADSHAVQQAIRQLRQAEAQLVNLESPGKPTEIAQAEANLADAIAARDKIYADLQRTEQLLKSGNASQQLADQRRADLRSAAAKVQALEAASTQMRNPFGRQHEINAQHAAVDAARAALAMAQWRLDQRHVVAPAAGVVTDVLARPGETVPAGVPVAVLLPPENIFVRFFVPEAMLAQVHYSGQVRFVCDNCPSDLSGNISFISPQAEYTPPVIYSESTRAKLVFRVEARPSKEQAEILNPGEPVSVRPIGKDSGNDGLRH
jgi:HlyD family secretion protein